ncbi:von willebrand factor protein [Rutstroemia sp. NJR-2017a BVV2]|nr:von willebrand factor protein [Rutstroemia sp. NJR-2017a BVV2]
MSSNSLNPFSTSDNDTKRRSSVFGSFGSIRDKLGRSKSNSSSTSINATKNVVSPAANENNPSDPPPAYTPQHAVPSPSVGSVTSPTTIGSSGPSDIELDGRYGLLATFDTVLLIDDSESMGWASSYPTCWTQTQRALQTIAPIITKYDSDGIDIYFMNNRNKSDKGDLSNGIAPGGWRGVTREDTVLEIFSQFLPRGTTPTGRRISQILTPYVSRLEKELEHNREVKPLNLIIITDGAASDDPDEEIIRIAKRLDKADAPLNQIGIQFFQVGNDYQATEALKALDDDLEKKGVRDMVDTVTWTGRNTTATELTGESILKAVLGAVVRRLDKKAASGEYHRG